ncbi:MAG: TIGR04283 family arsenosugar biosynthesis glycosyltransferase [Verrucomicrobiota bacterium]
MNVSAPFHLKTVSAIVPVLNEVLNLGPTLLRLRAIPEIQQIIVADGGSTDGTRALAESLGCGVMETPRGRGRQMRAGAERATGDVVLLCHADTWLPPEAGREMLACLADESVAAGGFWKEFRDPALLMRGQKLKAWLRLRLGRRIMGDQAMFLRRETLERIGGVPDVPLMEEFILCRELAKLGRLKLAGATVTTSGRRFQQHGALRTYALMWSVMLRYHLGATPEELARRYR